jgi:PhnB protein
MSITTTLHVNFRGQAAEALAFYQSVFGGDLVAVPYGEIEAGQSPGQEEQIAWGEVRSPEGFHVMAYDVQDSLPYSPGENAFYLALRSEDAALIERLGGALAASEGATIHVPFGPASFSPLYGKLTDRFGVTWIIDVIVPWQTGS